MRINENSLKIQKERATILATKQLFFSSIYQFNSILVIIFLSLRYTSGGLVFIILSIIFMLSLAYSWFNMIVIAIKMQEYISKAGHNLITAGLCPIIGNWISTLIVWRTIKIESPTKFLYDDLIRHNIRNIEALKLELDDKLRKKEISKKEYDDEYSRIQMDIIEYHKKVSIYEKNKGK